MIVYEQNKFIFAGHLNFSLKEVISQGEYSFIFNF